MELKGHGRRNYIEMRKLKAELDEAEAKAWDALARYKFQMFGYWAAVWVHLNRISGLKRPNPWKGLVLAARENKTEGGHSEGIKPS